MNKNPLVSVIIPVYNRENLITKSVFSVLNQSYRNLEVIVIDDNSNDRTKERVLEIKDSRLIYHRNRINLGPSKSRNEGIKLSKGELVAFQDSDDEWYPEKVEKQINLIIKSSDDTAAVYCGMEFFDFQSGAKIGEDVRKFNFGENFRTGKNLYTPATVTVMIKKSVLDEVGYFDDSLFAAEDTELAIRVSKKYKYEFVNEALVKVTRNHKQLTENVKNYTLAKEIIFNKHKDYLSRGILFELCKEIANYYILKSDYLTAKKYLKYTFGYKFNATTIIQYLTLTIYPSLLYAAYKRKYKGQFPHPSKEGQLISVDE